MCRGGERVGKGHVEVTGGRVDKGCIEVNGGRWVWGGVKYRIMKEK